MRKNWLDIYKNQDIILKTLSDIDDIFLAGGTAVQRFLIERPYRESDDLDFFVSSPKKDVLLSAYHNIANTLRENQNIKLENIINDKALGVQRFFCSLKENEEMVKLELLDFTNGRFKDTQFFTCDNFPRIENFYNLILYKLKALCDRRDTIKDLFDLYFLFKEMPYERLSIKELMIDLELKFKIPTGYKYSYAQVIEALSCNNRRWDIVLKEQSFPDFYIKEAIEEFRLEFLNILLSKDDEIDMSYRNKASTFSKDIDIKDYYELIETNLFISEHASRIL
jgi:hypothetical protein